MSLILKILLVALLHFIAAVCYPETGPNGNLYIMVSTLAWSGLLVFMNASIKFIKLLSGALSFLFNLAFFALMLAAIALTFPQLDRVPVLEKIQKHQFPDRESLNMGVIRFGGAYNGALKKEMKGLDNKIEKTVKKLRKD
jgi:hypothetical protein